MTYSPTDGWTPIGVPAAKIIRNQTAELGELCNELEHLRGQFARDDWAYASREEFDRFVGDIDRWLFKVGPK